MMLELHDSEVGNTLNGRVKDLDYDYQAEQWVQDTRGKGDIVKWVLLDHYGVRCVWERPQGSLEMPSITKRSKRFQGEWEKGPSEVAID